MRILFFIIDLNSGGAEWQLARLAVFLRDSGAEVKVVCMNSPNEVFAYLEKAGINTICLNYAKPSQLTRLARFAGIVREFKPDIIHTWMFHANLAGKLLGRWGGAKNIVASLRVAEKERRIHLLLERLTAPLNSKILCNSRGLAKFAESAGLPADKLEVIPNSFDATLFTFSERKPPRNSRWKLLFLGRVSPQKGLTYLFEALPLLLNSDHDFHLDIVGAVPDTAERLKLEKLAELTAASDRISFKPPLPHKEIPKLMREAHLLVLPSLWEGMPNAVMEAFASGLPVVATDIEGTNELVENGKTGLLANPADSASLAAKISEALTDYHSAVSMTNEARDRLETNFSPEVVHQRYLLFYESLLAAPR